MHEYYLKPFREVIQNCDPLSVMPAYSEIDGVPCSASRKLLTKILREELGFSGYTISDYGAVNMLSSFHKVADNAGAAGKKALHAGVDLEAPSKWAYGEPLEKSAQDPQVMREIDQAVERILYVKLKAQLWEKTHFDSETAAKILQNPKHKALAYQAALESIVLLKNDRGILPIDPSKKIGVFGPNADTWQLGDYTVDRKCKTPLQAIQQRCSCAKYEAGCGIFDGSIAEIQHAESQASQCDILILCVGGSSTISYGIGWGQDSGNVKTCGEGFDVSDLGLAGFQRDLVEKMVQTGKPVILVHINGRPLSDPWILEHCDAFIEMGYAGQEGADALADILFGKCSPSGHLTVSVPKSVGQLPVYYNHQPSARGFYHQPGTPQNPGRDYVFSDTLPLHSFGAGLGYTEFLYSNLQAVEDKEKELICVSVTVKNIGKMQAQETVQVYLRDVVASVSRPVKELKAFSKLLLCPGESQRVQLEIPFRELAFLDEDEIWCIEPGIFEVYVSDLTCVFDLKI